MSRSCTSGLPPQKLARPPRRAAAEDGAKRALLQEVLQGLSSTITRCLWISLWLMTLLTEMVQKPRVSNLTMAEGLEEDFPGDSSSHDYQSHVTEQQRYAKSRRLQAPRC